MLITVEWGKYIFLAWLPTFVNEELGFDLQKSGVIAVTPNISSAIVGFISGKLSDILIVCSLSPSLCSHYQL